MEGFGEFCEGLGKFFISLLKILTIVVLIIFGSWFYNWFTYTIEVPPVIKCEEIKFN